MKKWIVTILIGAFLLLPFSVYGADFYTEATARAQVRILLNETTASFWTDDQIDSLMEQGCMDISARSLCLQSSDTFLLVTSQYEYTDFVTAGADAVVDVTKVWGAFYISPDNEYIGLKRIEANQIADLPFMAAGPPKYYYQIANVIGILPLPTSAENGQSVRVYYSEQTNAIADLPNTYQSLVIIYAASMAFKKEHRFADSKELYSMYLDQLNALKQELYLVAPEVKK